MVENKDSATCSHLELFKEAPAKLQEFYKSTEYRMYSVLSGTPTAALSCHRNYCNSKVPYKEAIWFGLFKDLRRPRKTWQGAKGNRSKGEKERREGMGLFGFLSLPRAAKKKGVGRSEGSVTRKEKNLGKNN